MTRPALGRLATSAERWFHHFWASETTSYRIPQAAARTEDSCRRPVDTPEAAAFQAPMPIPSLRAATAQPALPPREAAGTCAGRWAYVLARFPLLSETFILREMLELERQGCRLLVYGLRPVRRGPRHLSLERLQAPVWFAPWWRWTDHTRQIRRHPYAYFTTLAAVVWGNRGDRNLFAGALLYWGKAIAIASRAERDHVAYLHAHYATHTALMAYIAHRLTGIPFGFTAHAHDLYCHRAMLAAKLNAASAVITISRFNQTWLESVGAGRTAIGAETPAIAVIPCGVDADRYRPLAAAPRAPRRGRRPAAAADDADDRLRLLAVGSLQAYKGHRYLIGACARLRGRLAFECHIVGGGRLHSILQRQIQAEGLDRLPYERVWLPGAATEDAVEAALAWADVFVLPSIADPRSGQMEGIPVAAMEAMAAGLPVIASRLSGIPELVIDGTHGLLVPPADTAALAEALLRLRDPELRHQMGVAGRRRVEAHFDLRRNARRLADRIGTAIVPRPEAIPERQVQP